MARRRGPYGSTETLAAAVLLDGEEAYDVGLKRKRVGDGSTPGGRPQATKADVDTLTGVVNTKASAAALATTNAAVAGKAAQSALDALSSEVATLAAGQGGGLITAASWTALAGYPTTGFTVGLAAEVSGDEGTHTDPVAGGTVPNSGRFRWSASPAGWERIGDTLFTAAVSAANAAVARVPQAFTAAATDDYARRLFPKIKVEGEWSGGFYLNYESVYFAGIPLYRFRAFLVAVGINGGADAVVASWSRQSATDPTDDLPDTLYLTLSADGAPQAGYTGHTATVWIDRSQIEWDVNLTTYTDASATGIDQANVRGNPEQDRFLDRREPARVLTVGDAGGHATAAAAAASLLLTDLTVKRSTFPNSDLSTPSAPALIHVLPGHQEEIEATVLGTYDTGLIMPNHATLRMDTGSRLFMNAAGGPAPTAPVIDMNFPGAIVGPGELEQQGEGYVVHIDAGNPITQRATVGPPHLICRHRHVLEDVTLRSASVGSNCAMIGMALSNGSTLALRRVKFVREGASAVAMLICHTTAGMTDPGLILIDDCWWNDELITGAKAIQLIKSHSGSVRSKVVIRNSQLGTIECVNDVGGVFAFERVGRLDGIAYDAMLDPA